jgi:hypothetical protein
MSETCAARQDALDCDFDGGRRMPLDTSLAFFYGTNPLTLLHLKLD